MTPRTKPTTNGIDGEKNRYNGKNPRASEANRWSQFTKALCSDLERIVNTNGQPGTQRLRAVLRAGALDPEG
jgi:hypothetical protein